MKKVLNIVLLFILGLGLISCDRMLKDPLSDGAGFGDLIISKANVSIAENLPQDLDLNKAKVMLDGKEIEFEQLEANVKAGLRTITIMIISDDESKMYSGKVNIVVKANEKMSVSAKIDTVKNARNKHKVMLSEEYWGKMDKGDASDIEFKNINKVTLAGGISSWSNTDTKYTLEKIDGAWVGYWDLPTGQFKFIVNEKWTGGGNLDVKEIPDVLTKFYDEDIPTSFN